MPPKSRKPSAPSAFPELEQAMRVIVSVPKVEVEASIAKQRRQKKRKAK